MVDKAFTELGVHPWAMHHPRIVEDTAYIYREGRLRDESVGFDLHQ